MIRIALALAAALAVGVVCTLIAAYLEVPAAGQAVIYGAVTLYCAVSFVRQAVHDPSAPGPGRLRST